MPAHKVLILMGSASDADVMRRAADTLASFGVDYHMTVASAHRTPDRVDEIIRGVRAAGYSVVIAGAGLAAHLAGFCASKTTLPVIGVPLSGGNLAGVDALLSTVQMPPGVPVATVGIDNAVNAALLAVEILAVGDADLAARLEDARAAAANRTEEAAADVEGRARG